MKRKKKETRARFRCRDTRSFFPCSLLFALFLWPSSGHSAEAPPTFNAQAWLLVDHDSGRVLAEHNADKPLPPASLTKLMVAYVVFEKLRAGGVQAGDSVRISTRAWNTNGARLFLRPETVVPLETLLKGMIVRSANDAAIALAEHLNGNEEKFVAAMNDKARQLGLAHTRFTNVTGLDSRDGGGRAASGDGRDAGGRATPGQLPEQPPRIARGTSPRRAT